jgi:hypothetical protein
MSLEHVEDNERELQRYSDRLKKRHGTKRRSGEKPTGAGFRVEKLAYFNFLGYFAWWASFRLLKQERFNPTHVRLFDQTVFPIV